VQRAQCGGEQFRGELGFITGGCRVRGTGAVGRQEEVREETRLDLEASHLGLEGQTVLSILPLVTKSALVTMGRL
jgi:hypothetical protein